MNSPLIIALNSLKNYHSKRKHIQFFVYQITLVILIILLYPAKNWAHSKPEPEMIYTLVDGILISPTPSAYTIGKNILRTTIYGYYYFMGKNQNSELYFPMNNVYKSNEDALLHAAIEYGFAKHTQFCLIIPYAPDWKSNSGSNRSGIADIAIFFKKYLFAFNHFDTGLLLGFKLNTSAHKKNPNWYGTNDSNFIIRFILSKNKARITYYGNIGYKKVIGSSVRTGCGVLTGYRYTDTLIGSIGFSHRMANNIDLIIESSYESHNKKGLSGYYLDICGGAGFDLNRNIRLLAKFGKNVSRYAPNFYIDTSVSIILDL